MSSSREKDLRRVPKDCNGDGPGEGGVVDGTGVEEVTGEKTGTHGVSRPDRDREEERQVWRGGTGVTTPGRPILVFDTGSGHESRGPVSRVVRGRPP